MSFCPCIDPVWKKKFEKRLTISYIFEFFVQLWSLQTPKKLNVCKYVLLFSPPNLNIFFVLQVFEEKIKQKVDCNRCGGASLRYQKFQELLLTIPPSTFGNNDLTMQLCLDKHFAPDTGVIYNCKNCSESNIGMATIKNELGGCTKNHRNSIKKVQSAMWCR